MIFPIYDISEFFYDFYRIKYKSEVKHYKENKYTDDAESVVFCQKKIHIPVFSCPPTQDNQA